MFELLKNDKKSFIMLAISILLSIVGLVCYIAYKFNECKNKCLVNYNCCS